MLLRFCSLVLIVLAPFVATAAVETWTAPNGTPFQAECLGVKGDYVVFKKTDGSRTLLPFAKLTPSDQARAAGTQYKQTKNTVVIASAPEEKPDPSGLTKIAAALQGKLVTPTPRSFAEVPTDQMADTRFYAVYFSASWCGPCRHFTPELVAAYPKIKAAHPEFEVIFVSCDRDIDSMRNYMLDDHMPWVALSYAEARTNTTLLRYEKDGIPNLVFIDGNGSIISQSYNSRGEYEGPFKVLNDIRQYFRM
jgi:nucleoredoxin